MKNVSFFLLILLLLVGFTTTSNMGLKIPSPGDTDYPTSISDSFTSIDQHDHTSGKGVQIPTTGIVDGAISTVKIANGSVTQAKLASLGQQISSSCGSVSTTSTTIADVTNLTISITTFGRPVFIGLQPDGATNPSDFNLQYTGSQFGQPFTEVQFWAWLLINRGGTDISKHMLSSVATSTNAGLPRGWPPGSIWFIDTPAAGTYTYKVRWQIDPSGNANAVLTCNNVRLIAYEL